MVMRIAPTFLRFGTFEVFRKRDPHTGGTFQVPNGFWLMCTRLLICETCLLASVATLALSRSIEEG